MERRTVCLYYGICILQKNTAPRKACDSFLLPSGDIAAILLFLKFHFILVFFLSKMISGFFSQLLPRDTTTAVDAFIVDDVSKGITTVSFFKLWSVSYP